MDNNQQNVKTESKNERNIRNNENNIRNAAEVAKATGHPIAAAIGNGVQIADKISGGRSTKKLAKQLNTANKIAPGGRKVQKLLNKSSESGASDLAGNIAAKKNMSSGNNQNSSNSKIANAAANNSSNKNAVNNNSNNNNSNSSNNSNGNNSQPATDNNSQSSNNSDMKLFSKKSKGISLKIKIWIISSAFMIISFIAINAAVLVALGIIDMDDLQLGFSSGTDQTYTDVSSETDYWFPIGGKDTEEKDGKIFASGTPISTSISSPFGYRNDPYTGEKKYHSGIDIIAVGIADYGVVNVIAAKSGKVTTANNDSSCESNGNNESCNGSAYGNYVIIEHDDGSSTLYGHLHKNTITVSVGDDVMQGQVIGKMGSSGRSTGTHLHFEVRENGNQVDPTNHVSADNPRPASKGKYVEGNSNKQTVCLTLKNNNLSNEAVAAIMTNMNKESAFNPNALGDKGTSYGLCQWHNERWTNLKNKFPDSYEEISSQVEFLINELQTSFPSVYNDLTNSSTAADEKTYYFCYNFERPANKTTTCSNRKKDTNEYLNFVNNKCN